MSAYLPKADILQRDRHFRLVPKADIGLLATVESTTRASAGSLARVHITISSCPLNLGGIS